MADDKKLEYKKAELTDEELEQASGGFKRYTLLDADPNSCTSGTVNGESSGIFTCPHCNKSYSIDEHKYGPPEGDTHSLGYSRKMYCKCCGAFLGHKFYYTAMPSK